MIYLDNAATTKPDSNILEAITPYITDKWQNPSALYFSGNHIRRDIEEVRGEVAKFVNAESNEIYFTSGAAESNNWAIRGFDDYNFDKESVIITTATEHKSIMSAIQNPALRSRIYVCGVFDDGTIDLQLLETLLNISEEKKILVSVAMANNEIGTIQNIKKIAKFVHKYGGILHTDATQALPHIPIDVKALGIDLMSASAQKMNGLKGTGFLYRKKSVNISPLIYGSQESEMRGGTENIVGIIALGEVVKHHTYNISELTKKRDYMINKLLKLGCKLNGSEKDRLPNNINVVLPHNVSGESMLYMLDMVDVNIATGSACNSKDVEPSYVLKAIGLSDEDAVSSIRISLSDDTEYYDIDCVVNEIEKSIRIIKGRD